MTNQELLAQFCNNKTGNLSLDRFYNAIQNLGLELDLRSGQFVIETPKQITLAAVSNDTIKEFWLGRNGKEKITCYSTESDEEDETSLNDRPFTNWVTLSAIIIAFATTPLTVRLSNQRSRNIYRRLS